MGPYAGAYRDALLPYIVTLRGHEQQILSSQIPP